MYRPVHILRILGAVVLVLLVFLYTDRNISYESDSTSLKEPSEFEKLITDAEIPYDNPVNYIDAVITYVNGSDPQFQSDLENMSRSGLKIHYSATSNRFQDHNDLKILLRSIETNGKIFRFIYLVLAGHSQIPRWLDKNYKRLKIVYHSDIWYNSSQLPTFNSLAIEANLHHIKGLSNVFVYFNDDLTLLNQVKLDDFVLLNSTKYLLAVRIRPDVRLPEGYVPSENGTDSHWVGPAVRTHKLIAEVCSTRRASISTYGHIPNHTPHVLMRSVLYQAERHPLLTEHFERTWMSRFREGFDVQTVMIFNSMALCYANISTVWSPKTELVYIGVNKGTTDLQYLASMKSGLAVISHKIDKKETKFLCMNDVSDFFNTTTGGQKAVEIAYGWRDRLFPAKSLFEL